VRASGEVMRWPSGIHSGLLLRRKDRPKWPLRTPAPSDLLGHPPREVRQVVVAEVSHGASVLGVAELLARLLAQTVDHSDLWAVETAPL